MLEIVDPGPLTSVQTPLGRPGWQHLGVPVGGAADPWSARLANRLVGNADEAPLLEAIISGPTIRFETPTLVALTGAAWNATLDGLPLPPNQSRAGRRGSLLRVGSGDGLRGYVAIHGLHVEPVLGSASTDLRSGFGGYDGRALRAGDRLTVDGAADGRRPLRWSGSTVPPPETRVMLGPHASDAAAAQLTGATWVVSDQADRTGVRLDGPAPPPGAMEAEVPSMGLPLGAIQVPPDGRPIVMLADRPVTGGYPVPLCVIRADIGRVAEMRPGTELRFRLVTEGAAIDALRHMEAALERLEPFSLTGDDETAWAGSLG